MSSSSDAAATEALWQTIEEQYWAVFFQSIFYGVYCVLISASTISLFRQGILRTKLNTFMFFITTTMFICATLSETLSFYQSLAFTQVLFFPNIATVAWTNKQNGIIAFGASIVRLVYILNDVTVVWRAWVIWGRKRLALLVLVLFLVGGIAGAITDVSLSLSEYFDGSNIDDASPVKSGERAMILALPTFATNAVSGGLILYKAWQHRAEIQAEHNGATSYQKMSNVLLWLTESAAIYCLIWIIYILACFQLFTESGLNTLDSIMVQVAGIYTNIIVLIVLFNRSQVQRIMAGYTSGANLHYGNKTDDIDLTAYNGSSRASDTKLDTPEERV